MCRKRYYVVGGLGKVSLSDLIDAVASATHQGGVCLVQDATQVTDYLVVARCGEQVQEQLEAESLRSALRPLPVTIVMTDTLDVWPDISLDLALAKPSEVRDAV